MAKSEYLNSSRFGRWVSPFCGLKRSKNSLKAKIWRNLIRLRVKLPPRRTGYKYRRKEKHCQKNPHNGRSEPAPKRKKYYKLISGKTYKGN